MFLVTTPKSTVANSYVTVLRANEIMARRLHTTAWDNATAIPSAEGYLVNDPGAALVPGATSVPVDGGSGTFTAGSEIQFEGDSTIYTVATALSAAGNLSISPGLVAAPADNAPIERLTGSERERALIFSTRVLDEMMVWYGSKRTEEQALRWPRSGAHTQDGESIDYDTIPDLLEVATAELALVLLGKDKFKLPAILGQGIQSARVGPLSVVVDKAAVEEVIPQNILSILSPLGYLESEAQSGMRIVPLRRG